jgi:hypothetical protein
MEFSEITPHVTKAVYSPDGKLTAITNGKKIIVISTFLQTSLLDKRS